MDYRERREDRRSSMKPVKKVHTVRQPYRFTSEKLPSVVSPRKSGELETGILPGVVHNKELYHNTVTMFFLFYKSSCRLVLPFSGDVTLNTLSRVSLVSSAFNLL